MIHLTRRTFPQPTVALYLGGTGVSCGWALQTMAQVLPVAERRLIELFFIDSQEPEVQDHDRSRHYFYRDLDVFRGPIYKDFHAVRFPAELGSNPVMDSSEGCGVTRIFGAASLVACRDDFLATVSAAVRRLRRSRRGGQPIQVFVTASSCGGTGAGMVLDAVALIRHLFKTEVREIPRIYLFLLGPGSFFEDESKNLPPHQRRRMQASTYALLKELHHFASGHPFVSPYRLRDEVVEVGNASDDDRLFDWVYYLDGTPGRGMPARQSHELTWAVAETQFHLAVSEVGRKVIESMPNQREERRRLFPLEEVHPRRRQDLVGEERQELSRRSRATFLAGFAVRNARFPAPELRSWFHHRWAQEALSKALLRRGAADLDALDAALGDAASGGGVRGRWGLSTAALERFVAEDPDSGLGLPEPAVRSRPEPRRLLGEVRTSLARAEEILAALETGGALDVGGEAVAPRLLSSWTETWLRRWPGVRSDLRTLGWSETEGRGLHWLRDFLFHAAGELAKEASRPAPRPDVGRLRAHLDEVGRRVDGLARRLESETARPTFRGKAWVARLRGEKQPPYSDRLRRATRRLAEAAGPLFAEVASAARRRLATDLAAGALQRAARDLKAWYEDELAATVDSVANAEAVARDRLELAEQRIDTYSGTLEVAGQPRPWMSWTTDQLAGDDLRAALEERVRREGYSVEGSILQRLLGQGIRVGRDHLSLATLADLAPRRIHSMVLHQVASDTGRILSFLDRGWFVDEARSVLPGAAAAALDGGTEPLLEFDRSALGRELQGSLVVSPELILPRPFGRQVGRLNRLAGRDPLRLTALTFVYGVPPNSLASIGDLYRQYRLHLGDEPHLRSRDRYPLHVFRGAAASFAEPYSPLDQRLDGTGLEQLRQVAGELGLMFGSHLDLIIHPGRWDPGHHDRVNELVEEILERAGRDDDVAARVFAHGRLPVLRRLLERRKRRAATEEPTETFDPTKAPP